METTCGLPCTSVTYNPRINAQIGAKDVASAEQFFSLGCKRQTLSQKKEVTYNRIINARTGANDAGKAEQWLTWMQ